MPLDGSFIVCLKKELFKAVDCHIDKIHIPAKNEFVFGLRGKGFNKKLFISLSPDSPRAGFIEAAPENPASPPMFCMLLRKHLSAGRITAVEGVGTERLIRLKVQAVNEMGDKVTNTVVLEFLGPKTNLILIDNNGKIIDAARRSDIEAGDRLIQPGATYTLPDSADRTDLLEGELSTAAENICSLPEARLCDRILQCVAGLSPLICRELAFRLTGDCDCAVNMVKKQELLTGLTQLKATIEAGGRPTVLYDSVGKAKDFSFIDIKQYGSAYTCKTLDSYSELLEAFYGERDHRRRLDHARADLLKRIKNLITRNQKKLALRKEELKKSADRERLRIYGELIKANIYRIPKGAESVRLENYYDPDCAPITIPLNSALSPANNAAKYFKEYKKACTAEQTLGGLIDQCEGELNYLDSVLFELQNANSLSELAEIRAELNTEGYISRNTAQKKAKITAKPYLFSKNGFDILVGKNNLQNDELTTKLAAKGDLWFHTKGIHGSHVIIITEGRQPDDDTLLYAASLAAYFSKARSSNQVPVDYTPVKFVKKPNGARPGMVIYTTNKTIYANPTEVKL